MRHTHTHTHTYTLINTIGRNDHTYGKSVTSYYRRDYYRETVTNCFLKLGKKIAPLYTVV
jgi:hypothetical protein